MAMHGMISYFVKLEDVFKRYRRVRDSALITLPSDATIADLQRTIMKVLKVPDYPFALESSDGRYFYVTPEATLASEISRTCNGRRFVSVYPLQHGRLVSLKGIFCKRENTIHSLYTRALFSRGPIIVNGPPGSGKSTHLDLLSNHITQQQPDANVFYVPHWTTSDNPDEDLPFTERFSLLASVSPEFIEISARPAWLLMDTMQDSYWDKSLWNWIKNIASVRGLRIILFCRYISVFGLDDPTVTIDRRCHMGLRPTDYFPVGLDFTQAEFSEYVRQPPDYSIDEELERYFFLWTSGHIGAIIALYGILQKAVNCPMMKSKADILTLNTKFQNSMIRPQGSKFVLADFEAAVPSMQKFAHELGGACELKKGLPPQSLLANAGRTSLAAFFRRLLKHGSLFFTERRILDVQYDDLEQWVFLDDPIHGETCNTAIRQGWVSTSVCGNFPNTSIIALATPLLQCWFSYHLIPCELEAYFESPLDLVCQVTALFRPSLLFETAANFGTQLENHYQKEFYRAASALTDGAVILSPDFGTNPNRATRGRIDFFLAHKNWGIEITRDGNRLEGGGVPRFQRYEQWLQEGDMAQYIFVDYRMTQPVNSHPNIPHLYHVVFDNKLKGYVILKGSDLSLICHDSLPKV
ncbi:hypothetical protein EDD85DRAFT_829031 [Armillaria nabsnona]|nr:hypothetical protein EDD85DRAFT_829031 [Armillaria nabsnona]